MNNITNNEIKAVILKLPHSKTRVPYTYHHDYLINNVDVFKNCSRSEVAAKHLENEEQMYAVALTELLNEVKAIDMLYLTYDEINVCKDAIAITDTIVNRYNIKKLEKQLNNKI